MYHAACMIPFMKTCIDIGHLPIVCPKPRCNLPVPLSDLRELLTAEQMERCQKFEWKKIRDQNPEMKECPTDGCDYLYFAEDENQAHYS